MFLLKRQEEKAGKIKKYTRMEMELDKIQYNIGWQVLKI